MVLASTISGDQVITGDQSVGGNETVTGNLTVGGSLVGPSIPTYAEGLWTPTIFGGTTTGSTTYGTQFGQYIKINKLVFVSFTVTWTGATGTGDLRIGGLPFVLNSTAGSKYKFPVELSGITFPGSYCIGQGDAGNLYFTMRGVASGFNSLSLGLTNSGSITGTCSYETN